MNNLLILLSLLISFSCFSFDLNDFKFKRNKQIEEMLSKYSNKELENAFEAFGKAKKEHKMYDLVGSSLYYRASEVLLKKWDEKLAKAAVNGLQFPLLGGDTELFLTELFEVDDKYQEKFRAVARSVLSKEKQKEFFEQLDLIKKSYAEGNG